MQVALIPARTRKSPREYLLCFYAEGSENFHNLPVATQSKRAERGPDTNTHALPRALTVSLNEKLGSVPGLVPY